MKKGHTIFHTRNSISHEDNDKHHQRPLSSFPIPIFTISIHTMQGDVKNCKRKKTHDLMYLGNPLSSNQIGTNVQYIYVHTLLTKIKSFHSS